MISAISNSLNVPKKEFHKRKLSSQKSSEYVTTFELVRTITVPNPSKPIRVYRCGELSKILYFIMSNEIYPFISRGNQILTNDADVELADFRHWLRRIYKDTLYPRAHLVLLDKVLIDSVSNGELRGVLRSICHSVYC
jgi:hypothetical protein